MRSGRRSGAPDNIELSGGKLWHLPPTASRTELLEHGSDTRFRQLVSDLLTIAVRMQHVREHLGQRMGISGAQYSILIAIARLKGRSGVAVSALARQLHVSSAFITTETRKLADAGLLRKRPNETDRRGVLLTLTRAGQTLIERHSEEIRAINDVFFGGLDRRLFAAMSQASAELVRSSERAVRRLQTIGQSREDFREAAE